MKRGIVLGVLILVVVAAAAIAWAQAGGGEVISYAVRAGKHFSQKIPAVTFDSKQVADIKAGKPVCLLLPAANGLKSGFMTAVLPYDPVTVWWVVTDVPHFHLVDPSYPKTGSISDKRRTFMPYVFDGAVCVDNGKRYLYQLLVMPFVAPRKYSLDRRPDREGFPWESAWSATPTLICSDKRNKEMEKFYNDAIQITHNNGAWHISPVPEAYRNAPQDARKAFIQYFVDTNPGGNLQALAAIVNKATSVALPTLHQNLMALSGGFDEHLRKYHSPEDQARYRAEKEAFLKSVGQ
jgi:hypothetical protein